LRRSALGRLLQQRREALGYSRTRLADAVGISAGTIEGWELGRVAKPPLHDVLRLARFLGLTTEELEAAVLEDDERPRRATPTPPPAHGRVPLLEQALTALAWDEERLAAALETSPARVQAWRAGEARIGLPELMTLAALLGLQAAGAIGAGSRIADISAALERSRDEVLGSS
jgi:transcriptional regulator with XRE-family HTH domain